MAWIEDVTGCVNKEDCMPGRYATPDEARAKAAAWVKGAEAMSTFQLTPPNPQRNPNARLRASLALISTHTRRTDNQPCAIALDVQRMHTDSHEQPTPHQALLPRL